ncbi:MAG: TonB-dependent receptor [Candidatus Latescibacterota bacterium]|nr:TonB-dependent receptor [Candidatus Latescibacterota bacterium]
MSPLVTGATARIPGLLLLWAGAVSAATLSGYVRGSEDGEPLASAATAVSGGKWGGLTNDRGYFAIRNLPAGRYPVVVTHIGYEAWRDTVEVTDADDLRIVVRLRRETLDLGVEIAVSADRETSQEQERSVQLGYVALAPRQLQSMPALGESDYLRSLQLLPGIQAASDVSSGLYIRGGGPDQTQILLDEIPLYNPSHAFGFFSTFTPDVVRDVQLWKSAYPANYGGNLGAVLDVANRDGNRERFAGRGGLSLVSGRLMLEGPVYAGSWMVAGRRTYLDPVLAAVRASGVDVPGYYFYDLNAKANQQLGAANELTVSGYFGRDDLDFDLGAKTFFNIRWGNRAGTARWTHLFSPALYGQFMAAASEYESTISATLFATPVMFANRIQDLTIKGDLEFFATSDHTLTTGFRVTGYELRFRQFFNQQKQFDLEERPMLLEAFVQEDGRLPTGTHVRLGLRGSWFSEGDRTALMPRLSVSQPLGESLRLKAGGGAYRQYLQLVTTEGFSGGDFWVPLDDSVPETRSWQAAAGLEWEPSHRYKVAVEGYYSDLDGLVVIDNDTVADSDDTRSEDIFKSNGSGYATGIELFAKKRTGRLRGWLGYTLGRTRRTFAEIDGGRSFAPRYDRRHDISLVTSYRAGLWSWGVNFLYATGQAFTPATARYSLRMPATDEVEDLVLAGRRNSARLLPYHRVDVSLRREMTMFSAAAQVYLQIFNLYSRRNEWFVQYDTENPATEPEVVQQLPVIPTLGIEFEF